MRRIPALDGIRGVAILLVVILHGWPSVMPGGAYGVTVFFVLSGYLITRLLVEEHERTGQIQLGNFYARRAIRLLPALFVFSAVMLVVAPWEDIWPALAYVANWAKIAGEDLTVSRHLWSLSVEEHFYLAWPLIVILAGKHRFRVAAGLLAVAVLWRLRMVGQGTFQRVLFGTDTAAFSLLAGCVLALSPRQLKVPRPVGYGAVAAVAALALTVQGWTTTFLLVEVAVAGLAVLMVAASVDGMPLLEGKALTWLGTVSYGLYLWHYPMAEYLGPVVGIPVGFAFTVISWRLVEQPAQRLRSRYASSHEPRTELTAALLSRTNQPT